LPGPRCLPCGGPGGPLGFLPWPGPPSAEPPGEGIGGRDDKTPPADVTLTLLPATVIHGRGTATAHSLVLGDLVRVSAAACRTASADTATAPTLGARLIEAHPARTT
jgi:hypothetical protein